MQFYHRNLSLKVKASQHPEATKQFLVFSVKKFSYLYHQFAINPTEVSFLIIIWIPLAVVKSKIFFWSVIQKKTESKEFREMCSGVWPAQVSA